MKHYYYGALCLIMAAMVVTTIVIHDKYRKAYQFSNAQLIEAGCVKYGDDNNTLLLNYETANR